MLDSFNLYYNVAAFFATPLTVTDDVFNYAMIRALTAISNVLMWVRVFKKKKLFGIVFVQNIDLPNPCAHTT